MSCGKFPKDSRLLNQIQFKETFSKPDFKLHYGCLMGFARFNDLPNARLGLAITKKKVPTAVARNQLKRLCREQFRTSTELPCVDIIFIVKRPIDSFSKQELAYQVQQIINKLIYQTGQPRKTIL